MQTLCKVNNSTIKKSSRFFVTFSVFSVISEISQFLFNFDI